MLLNTEQYSAEFNTLGYVSLSTKLSAQQIAWSLVEASSRVRAMCIVHHSNRC
jgi:hypothetical protein